MIRRPSPARFGEVIPGLPPARPATPRPPARLRAFVLLAEITALAAQAEADTDDLRQVADQIAATNARLDRTTSRKKRRTR